jgi:hypothetical protein
MAIIPQQTLFVCCKVAIRKTSPEIVEKSTFTDKV